MRAGIVVVVIGIGMWLLVLGGLPQSADTSGFTPVGDRAASLVSGPGNGIPTSGENAGASEAEPTPTPTPTATPEATPTPEPVSEAPGDGSVYVVEPGDTMARIAQAHGVSLPALIAANPQIDDPTRIEVGQEINIPE